MLCPFFYLPRPHSELRIAVAALILAPRSVQPHIGKVRGYKPVRAEARKLINAVGRTVPPQQFDNRRSMPSRLTKLEDVTMVLGQMLQKSIQPLDVHPPPRRKLKQDRPQLFPQPLRPRQQIPQRLLRRFQLEIMCKKPAGFHGKYEPFRDRIAPAIESALLGQPIKSIVEFRSIKMPDVICQHLLSPQILRIERAHPMLVMPSRGPNAQFAGHLEGMAPRRSAVATHITATSTYNPR